MNPLSRLLPLCTLGLGLGLGLAWFGADTRHDVDAVPATSATRTAPTSFAPVATPASPAASPAAEPAASRPPSFDPDASADPAPALSDEVRARLFADIEAAYTTYEVAALPKLTPYLRHSDPEVRAYAREGIVQLGQAEGAVALRSAAREARDAHEAAELLDAAAFLELPPAAPVTAGAFPPVAGQASSARRGSAPQASSSF